MKHTPKPWHANTPERDSDCDNTNIRDKRGNIIAVNVMPNKSNAKIIELAPEMFEALLTLLMARKESTEAFRRASYYSDVQKVLDKVEELAILEAS